MKELTVDRKSSLLRAAGKLCAGLLMAAGALALSATAASAATITVTTGLDEFGTGSDCSLREAIQSANIDADFGGCTGAGPYGNDVILFNPSVPVVSLSITTGSNNDDNSFLDLDIGDTNPSFPNNLTIDGGLAGVTIQPMLAPWGDRIIDIVPPSMAQPGAVVLRNLTIQGGSFPMASETGGGEPCNNSGGGVRNRSGGNLTLENVVVQNNAMQMNGGGVCHQNFGLLRVENSTIRNNMAMVMVGGGIYAVGNNASVVVTGSIVFSNTAGRAGGGIAEATGNFTMQTSQVLSNVVTQPGSTGGGVATQMGAALKSILTSTVAYNRAEGDGGGIYNQTARGLQVNASTVLSNTAGASLNTPGNGGGIWSGAVLVLNNTAVLSNAALISGTAMPTTPPGGGGIYQQSMSLNVNGGQVSYNLARKFIPDIIAGGGIWNSGNATLQNVQVTFNRADGAVPNVIAFGGGIFNANRLNVWNNSRVDFNIADASIGTGGGIYSSDLIGGSGAALSVQNSTVSTNTAQGDISFGFAQAGGIFSGGSDDVADILASEIRNNRAQSGGGAFAGGISSGWVLTLTSSTVISNAALGPMGSNAGGVSTGGSSAYITDTRILTNVANTAGGWQNYVSNAQMWNSTVRFNRALSTTMPMEHGGGIWNIASGVQVNVSTICDNQAGDEGGGIYNSGMDFRVAQSLICVNSAGTGAGGGVRNAGIAQIMQSQVLTNTSPTDGGGVHNDGMFVFIMGSTLRANNAGQHGGGAHNALNQMTIAQSTLQSNQAGGNGGGAYNAGTMSIGQSTLQSNQAGGNGGGAYNATGTLFIGQSTLQSNQATGNGGGAYNDASATNLFVNTSTFQGNSALDGGGLYNAGPANVSTSALVSNSASTNGGGIYNSGTLESVNNTVSGNGAPAGAGLHAVGGSAYLTHTTVASNTTGNGVSLAGGSVEVRATLLAYNTPNNCSAALTENGNSRSSDGTCGVSALNSTPLLQPLALNGGQTLNHALPPGSPALDTVPMPCAVSFDQRFVSRPQGTACDAGAFELEEADLEVSKSATPSPVIAGQTITYTVIVTNLSASGAANNVVLTDTLSGGATFGGVVSGGGFTLQSSTPTQAVFTLSSLPAGVSVTLVFTATAPASGSITNTVTVASGNPDPVLSNNTASITTGVIPAAYLSVSKAQDYVPYAPGIILPSGTVTYSIVITNNGPSTVPLFLQDTLAGSVTFVAASITPGSCSYSAPNVNCSTGVTIPPGGSATALITVTAPIASNTVFTNVANGFAPAFPGTPFASNVVTLTTAAQADLSVFKTATPSPVFAGQPVTYVVSVQNAGPDPAANVVITDVFQGGATFGSVIGMSGGATLQSSSATGVTFTVSSLPVFGTAVMTYTVIAPASGVITNTATASSDAVDTAPGNNAFSTTTPVTPVANLQISKAQSFVTVVTGTIPPGGTLTYTVQVTNTGPSSATSVTVTDNLPAGLTFVSATGAGWSCSFSAPTVTCTRPTLSVGAAPAIQIVATAPVTPGLVLTNTATVNAATHPNTPVTSNSVTVKVQFRAFVPIARKEP